VSIEPGADAGRREIGQELAGRALAVDEALLAGSGIDQRELAPVLSTTGLYGPTKHARLHESRNERRVHLLLLDVDDEGIGDRQPVRAVGDDSHLDVADL